MEIQETTLAAPFESKKTDNLGGSKTIDLFIDNFLVDDQKQQAKAELKRPETRSQFADRLNYEWDNIFQLRLLSRVPLVYSEYEYMKDALELKDSDLCYIISNVGDVDGQIYTLRDGFKKIYDRDWASILFTLRGDKMYLEAEVNMEGSGRFIGKASTLTQACA